MFNRLAVVAALASIASLASLTSPVPGAHAESRVSANTTGAALTATARLNVRVTVPRILYLSVGQTGATVNTVTFAMGTTGLPGTMPLDDVVAAGAPTFGPGTITTLDDANTPNDGRVSARIWTNNGTTSLSCAATALSNGATTILPTAVTVTSSSATLPHPGANIGCAAPATGLGTAGVNDLTADWTFAFASAALPAAGTYNSVVTYTATQP